MKKIWDTEKFGIFFVVISILSIGLVFQNWVVATLLPLVTYIIWIYSRLYQLEKWLSHGTKTSEVFNDNGFIGQIILHLYSQKKTNNKRTKRTKEILRRLNTNISALPDATILLNHNFEIEWANPPASYLFGIKRSDIGHRIDNLIRHPEFQNYLSYPDNEPNLEIQSPLDHNIILQIKAVSFGKDQRLLIVRNISEQKQLQEALKNFVANASHELQTPLTSIIGYIEILEMEENLSDIGKNSITILQQQSQRMKLLIQDLLILSRVESHQLKPKEGVHISISDSMKKVMATVGSTYDKKFINCNVPNDYYLLGVQSEIEGICINLIENAIKHSPKKTPISIAWKLNKHGEYRFSVTDEGSGINQQDLSVITHRYFRGSEAISKQIAGSGLGLAIVKQAANKHGAKLEIVSEINKGSTFSVTFPNYRTIPLKLKMSKAIFQT